MTLLINFDFASLISDNFFASGLEAIVAVELRFLLRIRYILNPMFKPVVRSVGEQARYWIYRYPGSGIFVFLPPFCRMSVGA